MRLFYVPDTRRNNGTLSPSARDCSPASPAHKRCAFLCRFYHRGNAQPVRACAVFYVNRKLCKNVRICAVIFIDIRKHNDSYQHILLNNFIVYLLVFFFTKKSGLYSLFCLENAFLVHPLIKPTSVKNRPLYHIFSITSPVFKFSSIASLALSLSSLITLLKFSFTISTNSFIVSIPLLFNSSSNSEYTFSLGK